MSKGRWRKTALRFPIEPLLEIVDMRLGTDVDAAGIPQNCVRKRAEVLGISAGSFHRWMKMGTIGVDAADRAAVHLGFHPVQVWGDLWFEMLEGEAA